MVQILTTLIHLSEVVNQLSSSANVTNSHGLCLVGGS